MLFHLKTLFFLIVLEQISLAFCIVSITQKDNNIESESRVNFFNVLQLLTPSVLEHHQICEGISVDFVFFSNSFPFFSGSIRDFQLKFLTISLILGTINSTLKFNSKFHQSCPIFLVDLTVQSTLKIQDGEEENPPTFELALYNSFLPEPWTRPNFYVFSVVSQKNESDSSSSTEEMMSYLKKFVQVRKIKEVLPTSIFLVTSSSENSGEVLRIDGSYELVQVLKLDSVVDSDASTLINIQQNVKASIFPPSNHKRVLNWNGAEMLVLTCPICSPSLDRFRDSGMWDDPMAAVSYEIALRINSTLELEGVFGQGNEKPDENGKWDAFQQPLIDGEAVISGVIRRSLLNRRLFLLSIPITTDRAGFIVAEPKSEHLGSLEALKQPLAKNVWLSMTITLTCAYLFLKLFIYFITKNESNNNSFPVFPALLESIVDQSGFNSVLFTASKSVSEKLSDATRIIIGTWLLGLIVLSAGYKSKFIERMTLPTFESIPTNFQELMKSDYEMGGILWSSNLQHSFEALKNNSLAKVLLDRVEDYNYFEPDCYRAILGRKRVCVGFKRVLGLLGLQFLIDVERQKMFILSSDSYFSADATLGVPRDYPEIFEMLNFCLRSFTISGLLEKWLSVLTEFLTKIGQKNALKYVSTNATAHTPAYKEYLRHEKKVSSQIMMQREMSWLSIQLLIIGITVSILVLLIEIGIKYWRKWRQKDLIQVISTSYYLKEETGRIYQDKILF